MKWWVGGGHYARKDKKLERIKGTPIRYVYEADDAMAAIYKCRAEHPDFAIAMAGPLEPQ